MEKISSNGIFFYKKVFPVIWFGFLGLFSLILFLSPIKEVEAKIAFIIFYLVMAGFGYFFMKQTVLDLADEVYDTGNSLIIKNSGQQVNINYKDIKNINYTLIMNPARVTLSLRNDSLFGKEISFSPQSSINPFKKNVIIEALIDKVDKARSNK